MRILIAPQPLELTQTHERKTLRGEGACGNSDHAMSEIELLAAGEDAAIEVEVVVMRLVVVGADRHAEVAAGAAMHSAQEAGLDAVALPVLLDTDAASVGELEGADVD